MIRRARPDEALRLSEIALRAKASWGYTAEFMLACRAELTLTAEDVAGDFVFAVEQEGRVVGFYSLAPCGEGSAELEHLFVEPEAMGAGFGRELLAHARARAAGLGCRALVIQSDPNAEGFYRRLGARVVGARESASIPGRRLPVLELRIVSDVGGSRFREEAGTRARHAAAHAPARRGDGRVHDDVRQRANHLASSPSRRVFSRM